MKPASTLPMPFVSAWDPRATASGSIDPLGALRAASAIATALLPGTTTITTRVRYLSWVCAGLRMLDEVPDAPTGGRAARARRQAILAWERLLALATGFHARGAGLADDDPAWRQLRGVSYVRRAVAEGVRSADFPMLSNQGGTGGVGTYWVTLVAGHLVDAESAELTQRGTRLADAFLRLRSTPDPRRLMRTLQGGATRFDEAALVEWGRDANLGAARSKERRLLAEALLEPPEQRLMAAAIRSIAASGSDRRTFQRLATYLRKEAHPLGKRLAAVLTVAWAFEGVHRELAYRFDQVRAVGYPKPMSIRSIHFGIGGDLARLVDHLQEVLRDHQTDLPRTVWAAIRDFVIAVDPAAKSSSEADFVRLLVGHHERVQAGKLDASRQPKLAWVTVEGNAVVVAPRFALDAPPDRPRDGTFTHPYRIEPFRHMLDESGAWESVP